MYMASHTSNVALRLGLSRGMVRPTMWFRRSRVKKRMSESDPNTDESFSSGN